MWIELIPGLAVGVMLAVLAVDLWICRITGRTFYGARQTAASLACFFSAKLLTFAFLAILPFSLGDLATSRPLSESSAAGWLACLISADFLYYTWHRSLHRVNALWALHIVHHQSDEFNFATGLRTGWFTQPTLALFYSPLLVAGFHPAMILSCATFIGLYQFALHTRHIARLGPLEWILCTPSNHRVHHGSDIEYLGKNFGGVFIIWDRLFGTFRSEAREPTYGMSEVRPTLNVFELNLAYLRMLASRASETNPAQTLRVWLGSPHP